MNMKVNLDHYNSYYFYYVIHTAMTLKLTDKATNGFITLILSASWRSPAQDCLVSCSRLLSTHGGTDVAPQDGCVSKLIDID